MGGVDLWFTAKGDTPVVVQLRETENDYPSRIVLAEVRVPPADIATSGHTRIVFHAPVQLAQDTEYAIVALCDDAVSALAVAQIGKFDSAASRHVTVQPYARGSLMSSSTGAAWVAHHDRDLTFRLLAARFTETSRDFDMGSVPVTDATDLMLLSISDNPTVAARVEYLLGLPDGNSVTVDDGQPVRQAAPLSGNVSVKARLRGTADSSPVIYPGTQMVSGVVSPSADYISRAIPAGDDITVRILFDALIPPGAGIAVAVSGIDAGDTWQEAPYVDNAPMGDGWMEMRYAVSGVTEAMLRVRITLTGSSAARPRLKKLRVMML
uniref:Uncharacterized protein n=1 Tax=Candidatus Kentrum sp. LPFa TaxID=2126335 RepID=A0A450WSI1_9GAMM|nr:MAG: hypothetical protein BECKLPF1236B_GA0070989_11933 [Candidatus Kentron sp. LPFa]